MTMVVNTLRCHLLNECNKTFNDTAVCCDVRPGFHMSLAGLQLSSNGVLSARSPSHMDELSATTEI
jgi:hypothetical protein